ncbi:MAG: PQ-loop repeat-containing protein [Opitutaceae bacterium]|nr:PQ-loop repeat-containing protein [Opitutaceae bacterium]
MKSLLLESLGWLGFGLCFACWFPQTVETIRARSCRMNVRFLVLNLAGCVVLVLHSVARHDLPFIILNLVCACGGTINLRYALRPGPLGRHLV